MKKGMSLLTSVVLFLLFSSSVMANEKAIAILEYKHDVTGDKQPENIIVYGIPLKEDKQFLSTVTIEMEVEGQLRKITYQGGYEPKIDFVDLNHDGVDDIFYSSAMGGSGGMYNYALHTVQNGEVQELGVPSSLPIEGYFDEDFEAVIKIPGLRKPILLDLWKRKKDYVSLGLYQENGMLNEPTELIIEPIAMFDIIPLKEGHGLVSHQQISGFDRADQLGTVQTTWFYKNEKWNPIEVKWIAKKKKK